MGEDFYGGETVLVIPAAGEPGFTTNAIMHGCRTRRSCGLPVMILWVRCAWRWSG
jgi:hypothetical protein